DLETGNAAGQREAGGANAGAKIGSLLGVAPAGRGCQQNGVVAEAVPAARLAQAQAAAEDGVLGYFECSLVISHRDATRARARRPAAADAPATLAHRAPERAAAGC